MEHFELVEKLVNTFGVSYEESKNALESCGWDPVEAAVILEKGKNGGSEPKVEEPSRVKGSVSNEPPAWKKEGDKFFKSIWNFLSLNNFVVKKSSGEVFLDIPIWLAILLLCSFFWAIIIILGITFLMGYRFSFSGPQLGNKKVQDAVDHAESVGEDFVEKVKNSVSPDSCEPTAENPEPTVSEPTENNQPSDFSDSSNQE